MGRPAKSGVDFFSHDTGAHNRRTLSALRSRFGNDGYAFWFILLELLGEQQNFALDCSAESTWVCLCSETLVDENTAAEILNLLARLGEIDKDLWQNHKVIWCQNFVDGLKELLKRRKNGVPEKPVFAIETGVFAAETDISAAENTEPTVFPQQKYHQNGVFVAETVFLQQKLLKMLLRHLREKKKKQKEKRMLK